ncbi:MAG: DUF421 domain-containing protein [Clostridiales bacterium]|nr:DUF421 domain-containing protein [Clostridiales bacterium]
MLEITITLVVGLSALIFSINILGKIQLSQATPFHFISALVLGELLGNAVYDDEIGILQILYTIGVWTLLMLLIEIITQKFRKTRRLFEGTPSIVIKKGQIDFKELKKNRMDLNELLGLMREKDVFSLHEINYAILESNGTLSILKKSEYENTKNKSFSIKEKDLSIPLTLVSDGEILTENLEIIRKDSNWLYRELRHHGIMDIKEVFYAEWHEIDGLYVSKK